MAITAPESTGTVTFTIDGREVTAPEGATIWQAAKAAGIDIPVLCHDERYDPVGVCRMCVVDVGTPAFAASCVRACENGMQVKTSTPELERSRATLTKLLVSDQPSAGRDPKQTIGAFYFARLNTISARPPEPGDGLTILSSSPDNAMMRCWSLPSAFGKRSPSAVVMRVLVASSNDQVPNDATVSAMAALFSSGVPSNREAPLNLGRAGFTTTRA